MDQTGTRNNEIPALNRIVEEISLFYLVAPAKPKFNISDHRWLSYGETLTKVLIYCSNLNVVSCVQ